MSVSVVSVKAPPAVLSGAFLAIFKQARREVPNRSTLGFP